MSITYFSVDYGVSAKHLHGVDLGIEIFWNGEIERVTFDRRHTTDHICYSLIGALREPIQNLRSFHAMERAEVTVRPTDSEPYWRYRA